MSLNYIVRQQSACALAVVKAEARIIVGFLLGCTMSVLALFLVGVGHGTYAPVALNASFVMWIPGIGFMLALFGAPFLWATYYGYIPGIPKHRTRFAVLAAVLVLHVVPGVWLAVTDSAFRQAFEHMRFYLVAYILTATAAIWGLIALSRLLKERNEEFV